MVSGREPDSHFSIPQLHEERSQEVLAYFGWESRYFIEGRDALNGDSINISSIALEWQNLVGGIWYGRSPDQRFDELQLTLALTHSIGNFDLYGGFAHFRFPADNAQDNELGAGIAWTGLPMEIELAADLYYSFEAGGYFTELSAHREFQISDPLTLGITVPFGINQGYVADGHDGANHIALSLELAYALSETLSLTAHATYSWALGKDASLPGDDPLIDFFHAGLGLQFTF